MRTKWELTNRRAASKGRRGTLAVLEYDRGAILNKDLDFVVGLSSGLVMWMDCRETGNRSKKKKYSKSQRKSAKVRDNFYPNDGGKKIGFVRRHTIGQQLHGGVELCNADCQKMTKLDYFCSDSTVT